METETNLPKSDADPKGKSPSSKNHRLVIFLIVAACILLGIGTFYYLGRESKKQAETSANTYPSDAPQLFDKMVEQSLLTSYMSELRIIKDPSGKELGRAQTTYDLTDMKNVRIFMAVEGSSSDNPAQHYKVQYISVPEGVYMSVKELGSLDPSKLGHWFPLAENGVPNPEAKGFELFEAQKTLPYSYMGIYVPGIYTLDARVAARNFVKRQELYLAFGEHVRTASDNGKPYYTYEIGLDKEKFRKFNELISEHFKTPKASVDYAVEGLADIQGKPKFWVRKDTANLERIDFSHKDGSSQTIYYYDYNIASEIRKPMPLSPTRFTKERIETYLKSNN